MPRSSHRLRLPPTFVPEAGAVPYPGYRLVRLRGRGGFATVWEATDPEGKSVALKFMSSQSTTSTARELRSLQAVQSLSHPHLLRTHKVWSLPGTICISMDLAEASLLDLLELYVQELGRLIEPEKLARYMVGVASALDFLNARRHKIDGRTVGLQHADVKPNNILLIGDVPLLADYGLAAPTFGPTTPCPRHGTAEFCAPEVFAGNLTDTSDQFGLAVTYYVLRTGQFPYPPPPPREGLKDYKRPDPDLSALGHAEKLAVARALAPIPQQRFASCGEFVAAVLAGLRLKVVPGEDGAFTIEKMLPGESANPARLSGAARWTQTPPAW